MTIQQMIDEREALLAEAEELDKKAQSEEGVTDEEDAKISANLERAEELKAEIAEARKKEAERVERRKKLEAEKAWGDSPQPRQTRQTSLGNASNVKVTGGEASGDWENFGEFIFKVRHAAINSFPDKRLEVLTPQAAAPGMRKDVDSEGGFLVPDQFRTRLIDRMYDEGEILSRIKAAGMYMSLTGNSLKIPYVDETSRATGSRWGGIRGYWVEETASITDSQPKFGQMSLDLKKAGCLGYVTEEMLEDYSASGQFLENAFVSELIFTVEAAIVRGDGAGKPLGPLNANCTVSVTKETNQTADTVWGPNVTKMWSRFWAGSRRNGVWLINQDVEPYLWGLTLEGRWGSESTSVDGVPIYYPAGTAMNSGRYATLLGREVLPVEYCSTVGTVGDIMLFDPASYVLVDKAGGPQAASSMHVRFTTDERTFKVTYRVDGQPAWASALTPYQGTNTLSPFVTLASRD